MRDLIDGVIPFHFVPPSSSRSEDVIEISQSPVAKLGVVESTEIMMLGTSDHPVSDVKRI